MWFLGGRCRGAEGCVDRAVVCQGLERRPCAPKQQGKRPYAAAAIANRIYQANGAMR